MLFDLPLAELREYRPDVAEPADFDAFWAGRLAAVADVPLDATFTPVATPVRHAEVFDVEFTGHGGARVKGWLLVPREAAERAATVVDFVGYGGGRGDPLDWLTWSAAGHTHLVMDTRGQGGGWLRSDTPDPGDDGAPSTRGFLTRGIAGPGSHYFTRLFVDAARAVGVAREHAAAAGTRGSAGGDSAQPVAVTGASQGGALAIAAAHLAGGRSGGVAALMSDVPFLAHFRRAAEVTDSAPYSEIAEYCRVHPDRVEAVFETLSYVDVVNHAKRSDVPALFSVGLSDDITPPSTVFAAYNHYRGPKDIAVYPFNQHEGGGTRHLLAKLAHLDRVLAVTA
jgi:cephalosporin-C deacetylase